MTRREFLNLLKGLAVAMVMPKVNWPILTEEQPQLAGQMPMTVPYTIGVDPPKPIPPVHYLFIPMVSK